MSANVTKSTPSAWTTARRMRVALAIAVKLAILMLLARTESLQFVYAGF